MYKSITVDSEYYDDMQTYGNKKSKIGIIFYPGGKVDPMAYEPLMKSLAEKGFFCVLIKMPYNLAVFGIDSADGVQEKYPNIKIDGISTKELTRENIHELFTMVLQDTWLFEGTVKENIIYNRENVSDERVKEVCKEVGLHHFIKTLPHGYDSKLSENDGISAGQRQLLTIARGMVEDSPFLILDEATSSIDTRTELLVQKGMDRLMQGRTVFVIAHRLSTVRNSNVIMVLDQGVIIERGSHEELIAKKGDELFAVSFHISIGNR